MPRAQVRNIFTVKNFCTVDIEKVHDRSAAGIVFETQYVTQFVYSGSVYFSAAHCFRRFRTHSDLAAKIVPSDQLRPCDDTVIQNVGAAIDDPYGASAETGFFMEVRDEHGIPKTERSPKSIRPSIRGVDLDADVFEHRPCQIIVFGARCIGAGPV